jgi:hypothetical protein
MNESPNQIELADQIAALRKQTFTLLLALIVVSGTLTVFLYRQASLTRRDIVAIKPQATQLIQAFNQNGPNIQNFLKQLQAFSVTHPDFQPILKKYGITPTNAFAPVAAHKK